MKKGTKIFLLWVVLGIGLAVIISSQEHQDYGSAPFLVTLIELLISLISFFLAVHEPNRKNKYLFLNFAIFFLIATISVVHSVFQPLFSSLDKYLPYVIMQYVKGIHYAGLAFAIIYLVIDSLFRELRITYKYMATLFIVGCFFISYFGNFLINPKYGYTTSDIQDFRSVDHVYSAREHLLGKKPTPEEIAQRLTLPAWQENEAIGKLYPAKNLQRIREIFRYLPEDNYNVLLYKPINLYVVKMNVLACFFIVLFFGYQYKKDPPQGAYIDKIMFLLLIFCSIEIFHAWSYIHAVEWGELLQIFVIGQYITIFILLLIAMFFGLRLRFVTSVAGEFYENELVHSAQHITRWRDWLDNIVLHYFFNPKTIRGVLFSQRTKE
ncbi:MAG: hypothetical protein WBW71_02230 [Bacteroidota bacterium]